MLCDQIVSVMNLFLQNNTLTFLSIRPPSKLYLWQFIHWFQWSCHHFKHFMKCTVWN